MIPWSLSPNGYDDGFKRPIVAGEPGEEMMGAREGIEHVVVLMLENRSFDCMFGKLYPKGPGFDGLSGRETNPYHKPDGTVEQLPVWNDEDMDPVSACIPDPDPGELFTEDMNVQLFGLDGTPNDDPPAMTGFVDNYVRQPPTDAPHDPRAVMHYFTPKQVPVISTLAKAFGVSDQWHAWRRAKHGRTAFSSIRRRRVDTRTTALPIFLT
jgi:phospholipase C